MLNDILKHGPVVEWLQYHPVTVRGAGSSPVRTAKLGVKAIGSRPDLGSGMNLIVLCGFESHHLDKYGCEVKRLRCLPVTQFGAGSTPVTSAKYGLGA